MGSVIGLLLLPAAGGLIDAGPHGGRHRIGVHDDHTLGVAGGPAHGLDQAGLTAEEALLIRVQNGNQTHLRDIQALTQQVNAHQHVKLAQAQIPDDLHALNGADVMVHIPAADAGIGEVIGQIFRHFLGQGGHQAALALGDLGVDLADQIVDLTLHRANEDFRVQQTRGPDDLFHHLPRPLPLVITGGGGDIDPLVDSVRKLLKFQGPVIKGRGQAEAVIHQGLFPGPVPTVHGPHLGQGHMAFIHEEQEVLGEIVQQGHGRTARRPVGNDPGIVLDAGAIAQLLHHFNIIIRALLDALGLNEPVLLLEEGHSLIALRPDTVNGGGHLLLGGHIVAGRIDGGVVEVAGGLAGDHVDLADAVDLVTEELHPYGLVVGIGGENLHRVPPDTEHIALKGDIIALIADLDQLAQQLVKVPGLAWTEGDHHVGIINRVAQTINTGNRSHHNYVSAFEETGCSAVTQALDLIVDGAVLFNKGVRMGNIGLRLVVVVIAYKILHRVFGKELLELAAELGRQGLVMGQHQGGPVQPGDDVGHGKGLAAAGDAQQHLLINAVLNAGHQAVYGLRLVAGGLILRNQLKMIHLLLPRKKSAYSLSLTAYYTTYMVKPQGITLHYSSFYLP